MIVADKDDEFFCSIATKRLMCGVQLPLLPTTDYETVDETKRYSIYSVFHTRKKMEVRHRRPDALQTDEVAHQR
jgi:hypothetical protein